MTRLGRVLVQERKSLGDYDLTVESTVGEEIEERLAANVVSLMNTNGGTVIIGVNSDGAMIGLTEAIEQLGLESTKEFKKHLKAVLLEFLGEWAVTSARIVIQPVRDSYICLVEASRTPEPVSVTRHI